MATIYSIYRATCIVTNKSYIGFTRNFDKRLAGHKYAYPHSKTKFYSAIRKYGWDAFVWEVIFQSTDKEYCLSEAEPMFIRMHESIAHGYNTAPGGEGKATNSGNKNGMFGRTHTPEVRLKLSIAGKQSAGKTYEQRYGEVRASKMRALRSAAMMGKNNKREHNPRFDPTEYTFFNNHTGEMIQCTKWTLNKCYGVSRPSITDMFTYQQTCRGWCVIVT
jgi:group I intron endonuclease